MFSRILAAIFFATLIVPSPSAAAPPRQVKWEELSIVVGKTVSIALPGAVVITGIATAVEADALVVQVRKTTDPKAHPKGQSRVPRANLHTLEMRTKGRKYRIAGTVVGTVIGLVGGAFAAYEIDGPFSASHNGSKAAAAFIGIAAVGAAGGYLAGNAADRQSTVIEIIP